MVSFLFLVVVVVHFSIVLVLLHAFDFLLVVLSFHLLHVLLVVACPFVLATGGQLVGINFYEQRNRSCEKLK